VRLAKQLPVVKNHYFVKATLLFLILFTPAVGILDLTNGAFMILRSENPLGASLTSASLPMSQDPTFPGQAFLVGSVNVQNLPDAVFWDHAQTVMPILYPQGSQTIDQGKNETEQVGFVPAGETSKTITASPAVPQTSSASVNLVLEGVSGGSPNPCACTPPDPNDAVGPNRVFEMVNLAGIIYLKNGTVAKPTFPLSSFFGVSGAMSDPQILYDSISERWFASITDISDNSVRIAVSTSDNPTGMFNLYSFSPGTDVPDQPYIGTSDDKFVITANDFASSTGPFVGVQYWILNKAQLVNGSSTVQFSTNTPDSSMFTLRPVRHLTSTKEFYLVTDCIGSCLSDSLSTTNTVELVTVNGVPPGAVSVAVQTFTVSTSTQPPNAAQPGTRTRLVTNDNRILSAVWELGILWLSWGDACVPSGDSTTRSCVRLVQVTVAGNGTATKNQDFDYASVGTYLFYPSLTLYHGQMAVIYGESSSTLFPSLFVTGQIPSDPANTLETPATIKTGTADDLSTRYGDYFGAGTDPTPTNNSTFWVSGEYRVSSTSSNWSTSIAQVGSFAPDFTLIANPSNITMQAGSTGNSTLTIKAYKFTGNINLNVNASPTGLSCTLNPSVVTLGASSTSKLTCSGSPGTYNATVIGTSGSITHSLILPATVQPSGTVGGSILSIDKSGMLLSYATPLLALMVLAAGAIISKRARRTGVSQIPRQNSP
jgi:hypothetical protein